MKIAAPHLPFAYLTGICSTLKTLEDCCDLELFMWNTEKPLMDVLDEVKPDLLFLYQDQVNTVLDLAAESMNFNYIVLTSAPVQVSKQPAIYITDHEYIKNFIRYQRNTLMVKPSANVAQIHNGKASKDLESDICIFNIDINIGIEHLRAIEWMVSKYNVKIFGPQKMNFPNYLGSTNIFERANILKSSKVCIDLGNFDCLDASYLQVAPVVFNGSQSQYKNFKSIKSLEEILHDIVYDNKNRETYCNEVYKNVIQGKTFYHRVAEMFTLLSDQTRSRQCLNKLKELIS
tara:strand:+ start:2354 stop:3220 length:867 start_codon:yes stop_codon:yes gene_type:complete